MKPMLAAASAVFFAFPAWSEPNCAPRADVLKQLSERYGETRRALGLAEKGIVEVYASDETGTWTVLGTFPNGVACVISHGTNFETMTQAAQGDDT